VTIFGGRLLGKGGTGGTLKTELVPDNPPPSILDLVPLLLSDDLWLTRFPENLNDLEYRKLGFLPNTTCDLFLDNSGDPPVGDPTELVSIEACREDEG
jgi:hypothetical protein